jgi:thiamine biosynthesis lipoprotein
MTGPRLRRRRFLTLAAGFAAFPAFAAAPLRWEGVALGAHARLELAAPERVARPALEAALAAIREAEALFSLYDPRSTLSRLNAAGALARAPAPFVRLMDRVDALHRLSGGRFDPTVQPLWRALAEGADAARLARARAAIGWHRVRRDGAAIRLAPGQALTLNGIAQGAATDMVLGALRRHGLEDAFVDIGEQAAMGRPRRLGLEDAALGHQGQLTLRDGAMATSSPRATPLGGGGHVLSPAGDAPRWATVTVEARDATLADGLSTALCLADTRAAARMRASRGIRRVVLIDDEGRLRSL